MHQNIFFCNPVTPQEQVDCFVAKIQAKVDNIKDM